MSVLSIRSLILSAALLGLGSHAMGDCLPGSSGPDKVLVHYRPGPNWNQINSVMKGHVKFLSEQTIAHEIEFAGPVYTKNGDFVGGMVVFNSNSISHVESILVNDPALKIQAAVYEVQSWGACTFGEISN